MRASLRLLRTVIGARVAANRVRRQASQPMGGCGSWMSSASVKSASVRCRDSLTRVKASNKMSVCTIANHLSWPGLEPRLSHADPGCVSVRVTLRLPARISRRSEAEGQT